MQTTKTSPSYLGLLPYLSVSSALGLLCVSFAYSAAVESYTWAGIFLWLGWLILYIPNAARMLIPDVARSERIGIILLLGFSFFLIKAMYSPLEFKFADELQHWRTADIILQNDTLFDENFILQVSPYYPALQIVTTALSNLTGLPIFESGMIVIAMARIIFVLGLYLFFEKFSRSSHIAGIASILYMTNPHYQFLNAMFTYQAMALALLAFALFAYTRLLYRSDAGHKRGGAIVIVLALASVTVTHHVTSYFHTAMLMGWALVAIMIKQKGQKLFVPIGLALLCFSFLALWVTQVATITTEYLGESLYHVPNDVINLVERIQNPSSGGEVSTPQIPLPELLISMMAVGLISLGVMIGLFFIRRRYRKNTLATLMGIVGFGYYASIVLRFVPGGAELTGRSWPFLFIGVAFTLAVALVHLLEMRKKVWQQRLLYSMGLFGLIGIFLGSITSGWPPYWARLPGEYRVAASERSVDLQSNALGQWARESVPERTRISGSFTIYYMLGSYGEQHSVFGMGQAITSPRFGARERSLLRNAQVTYVVIDYRMTESLPKRGFYFDTGESSEIRENRIDMEALQKFESLPQTSRVYDSGVIIIYDIEDASLLP